MGRKGNSKRKPSQKKTKPVITAGGGNSISSLVQGKDKQPVRIVDAEKDSVPSGSKKGQKKG